LSRELRAGVGAGLVLVLVYLATLAPDVTWWDSGEFVAAAHSLGIPHPPGAPLYILLANVSSRIFWFVGPAAAVNVLSAICTALAGAFAAAVVASISRSALYGIAAAICGGAVASVWLNATEAEVYAPSLLLASLMLWSAYKAGQSDDRRWIVLTCYLIALAAPLHLTALLAAPAAIALASWRKPEQFSYDRAILISAVALVSVGTGKASWQLAAVGLIILVAHGAHAALLKRSGARVAVPVALLVAPAVVLALTCLAFLPLRALWDPLINQGNPATLGSLLEVLSRSQYDVAPLFPRRAPVWLQVGNYFQYLDWQFALGTAPTVLPSVLRSALGMAFLLLAAAGMRQLDRKGARLRWSAITLILSASIGAVAYLNLRAGPSIGYGIIADDALHEARERDYFFVLSFWTIGLLAGAGAVHVAARWKRIAVPAAIALAGLPMLLNFGVANRRLQPDAMLPRRLAHALLEPLPDSAVLFVAGDNDSYPLWYLQSALRVRTDVTVVTIPLLGADWYREELGRRHALTVSGSRDWKGLRRAMRDIEGNAVYRGRPVAVSVSVPARDRLLLGGDWILAGFHYRRATGREARLASYATDFIDVAAVESALPWGESDASRRVRASVDPVAGYMSRVLECPLAAFDHSRGREASVRLDSNCNWR
jgi:hypothetical protein